jgi:hypothetical protein
VTHGNGSRLSEGNPQLTQRADGLNDWTILREQVMTMRTLTIGDRTISYDTGLNYVPSPHAGSKTIFYSMYCHGRQKYWQPFSSEMEKTCQHFLHEIKELHGYDAF